MPRTESPQMPGKRNGVRRRLREAMLTGIGLTVPLIVTVIVMLFFANFLGNFLTPVARVLSGALGLGTGYHVVVLELLTVVTMIGFILCIGLVAESTSGQRIEQTFDAAMARIPAVGSVYTSVNEMSDILLSTDSESFQEVYLVEYPVEGSYTLAFLTADTPDHVAEAVDSPEMVTLFMPMAPNPVMGGFVIHVSVDRVHEVDMTVEEGLRSIVTSGVTMGENGGQDAAATKKVAQIDTTRTGR